MNGTGNEACISAETVPPLVEIPTEPKAFQWWLAENSWVFWPEELQALAFRALASLRSRGTPAWDQSYALRKAAKADWSAFTTAYREHAAKEVA